MLEDVDSIDWASVNHAHGAATDVPDLLRGLASVDAGKREAAIYELFGNVWHQGTIYSATAAVVPFLYALLATPAVQDKSQIACLLASIATGRGYYEVHATSPVVIKHFDALLEREGRTLPDVLRHEATITDSVRRAISRELFSLPPFLHDPDLEVRRVLAGAFTDYPEHAITTLPALRTAAAAESNGDVREVIETALSRLGR